MHGLVQGHAFLACMPCGVNACRVSSGEDVRGAFALAPNHADGHSGLPRLHPDSLRAAPCILRKHSVEQALS